MSSTRRMRPIRVIVNDLMQTNYVYHRIAPVGRQFHDAFEPDLTPREMLTLGVFGGKYMTDCRAEFPKSWFARAKLCHERHDPSLNFFGTVATTWDAGRWTTSDRSLGGARSGV